MQAVRPQFDQDKALRKLISKGYKSHVVYEAGHSGFVIWRHLPHAAVSRGRPHGPIAGRISAWISSRGGQMSPRWTGRPSRKAPA
jgi:hypothetical protein